MNDAKVVFANHFVEEMTTVDMVKCVKTLFVQLAADRMFIALVIWCAWVKSALIHVKSQLHAASMQIVLFKITSKHVFVPIIWLAIHRLVVNMHPHRAQRTMNVRRIIRALEIFANQTVTTTKTVWLMNAVYEEHVDRFVIVTLLVETDKFVKIDFVKSVAEMI